MKRETIKAFLEDTTLEDKDKIDKILNEYHTIILLKKDNFYLHYYMGFPIKVKKIKDLLLGGYDIAVNFDDSIIEDRKGSIDEGVNLVASGLMSKFRFLETKLGYTQEEAKKEIEMILAEQGSSDNIKLLKNRRTKNV